MKPTFNAPTIPDYRIPEEHRQLLEKQLEASKANLISGDWNKLSADIAQDLDLIASRAKK